ncbi:MAG: DoxX family membrane protein [bacterium]|nr:DoxX family membrane protein [bacterium]
MNALALAVRLALGLVLVVTGALKVGHAPDLAAAIAGFRLLPGAVVAPMALILPYFELLLGGYLLVGLFTRAAAWIACAQFAIYAAAIASAVLRHIPANCGCFGPHDQATADWPHVAFDLALALLAAFVARRGAGLLALDGRLNP